MKDRKELGKRVREARIVIELKKEWKKFRVKISVISKWRPKIKRMENETQDAQEPRDDGYDGYYDDILPEDAGRPVEGLDKELLKRVALIMGGMLK